MTKRGSCRSNGPHFIREEGMLPDRSGAPMFIGLSGKGQAAPLAEKLSLVTSLLRLSEACSWSPTLKSCRNDLAWCARTLRKRLDDLAP